jgi:hypothetical protein
VATDRQIAANRRNAGKSTGPRSPAGRKRASRNAYRHGLSSSNTSETESAAAQPEELAREILLDVAGKTDHAIMLGHARSVAYAILDLDRVRKARLALIEQVRAFGGLDAPEPFRTVSQIRRFFAALDRGILLEPKITVPPMPSEEPERTAVAIQRALPELLKLERYERRAASRRDRALRDLTIASRIGK